MLIESTEAGEESELQPPFRSDITGYESEFPGDVAFNVLMAAPPGASIQMSLTTTSGVSLPVMTADGEAEWSEPQLDALRDAVAEMESSVAQ